MTRLIVALDVPTLEAATRLVDHLSTTVPWFKIGSELFTVAGPQAVTMVRDRGGQVFLDLKYHDIPHTVGRAVAAAARLGVSMLNVHVAAGEEALHAATEAVTGSPFPVPRSRPLLLGVTLLTSQGGPDSHERVVAAARLAQQCGLDGVVASAHEVPAIKRACGTAFICVTPGIRPSGSAPADQRRITTPAEAAARGADFLVVGRPVLVAADPLSIVRGILSEIGAAAREETGTPAGN